MTILTSQLSTALLYGVTVFVFLFWLASLIYTILQYGNRHNLPAWHYKHQSSFWRYYFNYLDLPSWVAICNRIGIVVLFVLIGFVVDILIFG
jgi:hypothetical protein